MSPILIPEHRSPTTDHYYHETRTHQFRVGAGRPGHGLRHPQTKEIGFDTIDIFADPLDIDAKERKRIRTECEKAGLPIVSVACVAVGLIDFNPSVQRFHLDRCEAYLDFCYELEAKNLLLVLGEYIWEKQVIPPAEQWETASSNCKQLGDYAADLGLQIALELEPFKLSLLNNVPNMVAVHRRRESPGGAGEHRRLASATGQRRSRRNCGDSRARRSTFTSAIATARFTATCRRAAAW